MTDSIYSNIVHHIHSNRLDDDFLISNEIPGDIDGRYLYKEDSEHIDAHYMKELMRITRYKSAGLQSAFIQRRQLDF